jgi:hypothetical protein
MKVDKLPIILLFLIFIVGCSTKQKHTRTKLIWHNANGYRWATLIPFQNGETGFKQLPSKRTGITFNNHLSDKDITENRLLLSGSGVAAGDINGDGLPDLYFTALDGPNKLYLNEGNFHFRDITKSAGVALRGYTCAGAVFADVNGDSKLDLLVTTYNHGTILFLNDGNGHFKRDKNSGLDSTAVGGTTMTLVDIDEDGDLDLYVAHYNDRTVRDLYTARELGGRNVAKKQGSSFRVKKKFRKYYTIIDSRFGPTLEETGVKDELYVNKGGIGKKWRGFKKVKNLKSHFLSPTGKKIGLSKNWGLTARFEDINGDGLLDLYVCNDYWTPDQFWINQGNGIFKQINPLYFRHMSFASMSVAVGDINNDGSPDLFVSDMLSPLHSLKLQQNKNLDPFKPHVGEIKNQPQYSRNMLFVNRGDNTFTETARYSGVAASGWTWASTFLDVNLDGWQDLLVNTGYLYDVLDLDTQMLLSKIDQRHPYNLQAYRKDILRFPPLKLVNKAYKNNGDFTFTNVSEKWGFRGKDISQGMAKADLNNDGALDLVTNRMNQTVGIYENTTAKPRIDVRLIGDKPNTQAIGARVILRGGSLPQYRQVISGGSYLSGSDTQLMFAPCKKYTNCVLIINWPDGKKSQIDSVWANRIYEISESAIVTKKDTTSQPKRPRPVFKDASNKLNFKEHEDTYDDFKRQPLMPLKLSQLEPGMAWIDYNGDGRPDLFETSGKGGCPAVFENIGHGRFKKRKFPKFRCAKQGDQSAIIGWRTAKGMNIVIGRSNYEQRFPKGPSAYKYVVRRGHVVSIEPIPGVPSSTGPLAAADYNEDGTVGLFVGGRVIPGQYPQAANSRLFKNIDGHFVLDKVNSKLLRNIGMVTGAVFTDYNQDGWPDLLLSTAWGTLKLFENDHGRFRDVTKKVGLAKYCGWWNGVATGDFNNDGHPDIVATNLGTNSRYRLLPGHPLCMYYDNRYSAGIHGIPDIIQANYDTAMNAYVSIIRHVNDYSSVQPINTYRVKSYHDYATSSLKKLVGPPVLEKLPYKQINTLRSMVFISKSGRQFAAHSLPRAAQLTANFDASVADYNNDGNEDVFLSQNFFEMPPGNARLDGGRGLWLKGDGQGYFVAVPGQKSGIKIYGEQRGAALGDFNEDGKIDLAVSQNGNKTKLYVNQTAKRGLRIRLAGPSGNCDAIGASIRLVYPDGTKGPRREIQAGSGYWSQNSFIQVMGYTASSKPTAIMVKWPNGIKEKVNTQPKKWNYVISYR